MTHLANRSFLAQQATMSSSNNPNTITGARMAQLREQEALCATLESKYRGLVKFLDEIQRRGATLEQMGALSSTGRKAQMKRAREDEGESQTSATLAEQLDQVKQQIERYQAIARSAKIELDRAQEQKRALEVLLGV